MNFDLTSKMNDQSQPGRSNFGPRLKLVDQLPLRKSKGRFRSKPMLKIDKDCQNYQANLKYMNICKRKRNAHDQRANVAKQLTKKNPPKDREVGPWNALVPKNCESKHSRQLTTLSLENSLNLSRMDFKCSKTSRDQNIASKKMKMAALPKSKNDSNATSGCLEQSHHMDSSFPTQLKVIASLVHNANNVETSNLNNSALVSRSEGRSNPYQGEYIKVGMDGTKKLNHVKKRRVSRKSNTPMASRFFVVDNNGSNKEKGSQHEVMTKEKGMIGRTSEATSNGHKQTGTTKKNEVPNSSSLLVGKKRVQGFGDNFGDNVKNHSRLQSNNASFMEGRNYAIVSSKHMLPNEFTKTNLKLPNRNKLVGGNGKTNDNKCRRKQPLLEEMLDAHGGIGSDGAVQHDLTCRSMKRWRCIEDNEDEEDSGGDQCAMVFEHVEGVHLENLTAVSIMKQRRCTETNEGKVDSGYQNPFDVENDCEGVQRSGTYKSKKKRRKYIETSEYEDEMCDQHQVCVEGGTNELTQADISKHCVQQSHCCSKPIDKPRWSGIFKIDGKECISLTGYFSTKSCEKVRKLLLPQVVQVTKVPRLAAWPKIWKASKPTGDSIGLYFFPHEMRHDEELDQLVKEVINKDLVLRAVIDEAEMLIFPSVLLPERHQTLQTKHYLWAAFKAKEDKGAVPVEQEEDKEKHVSIQLADVQSEESDQETILMKCDKPLVNQQLPANIIQEVETCCIQRPTNLHLGREAPEEKRLMRESSYGFGTSAATSVATDATTVANAATFPSEATSFATNTSPVPANHGPISPSMEALPCSSSVFHIVVRQTQDPEPKVQQFIQDMEREGLLVAVMQGEVIGPG